MRKKTSRNRLLPEPSTPARRRAAGSPRDTRTLAGQLEIPTVADRLDAVRRAVILAGQALGRVGPSTQEIEVDPVVVRAAFEALVEADMELFWLQSLSDGVLEQLAPSDDQRDVLAQLEACARQATVLSDKRSAVQ